MKYRIQWAKRGKLRYVSHHDEATIFERSARRAGLPLKYSQGFSPHPKMAFGSGLPLGYGSEIELIEMELTEDLDPGDVVTRFNTGLPQGIEVVAAARVAPGKRQSLGAILAAADYVIRCDNPELVDALGAFMDLGEYHLVRPHKGKFRKDDLRAGVFSIAAHEDGAWIRCALQPKSVRPSDVVTAAAAITGAPGFIATYERIALLDVDLQPVTVREGASA